MTKKSVLAALALALLAWAPLGASCTGEGNATFEVSNLVFEHAMLYNLINEAIQNNGVISNFSGGPNAGVLSVTIKNTGNAPGYCYIYPIVKQGGNGAYNCTSTAYVSQMTVATGPLLQTINCIAPGQTLQANVGSFEVVSGNGFNGAFCMNLQNLVNNNFGSGNSNGGNNNNNNGNGNGNGSGNGSSASSALSAAGTIVHELVQLQMNVCVLVASSSGQLASGPDDEACTEQPIGVFSQAPSVVTSNGLLVFPNNTNVSTPLPTFLWTPSMYNGSTVGLHYELVLSLSANGNPWYGIQIPAGQTFYKYQSTDRALTSGQKYWWYVITLNSTDQPVGGQNGLGWNTPPDSFTFAPMGATGAGVGVVTLPQLSALIQQNASPAVLQALAGMQIVGVSPVTELADPDAAALVAKPTEIKNISVQKF
jgi:hypothetical protein